MENLNNEALTISRDLEIPDAEIGSEIAKNLKILAREAKVPGFRPGRVPEKILRSRIGDKKLRIEAIEKLLQVKALEWVESLDEELIAPPEIHIKSGFDSGDVIVELTATRWPKVTIDLSDAEPIVVPSVEVRDEDYQEQVDLIKRLDGKLVESNGPVELGSFVTVTIYAQENGEVSDSLSVEDELVEVGKDQLLESLDELLVGHKAGEVLNYRKDNGHKIEAKVIIKNVKQLELPQLTDELVAQNTEYKSVNEFLEALKNATQKKKMAIAHKAFEEKLRNLLIEKVQFEPPKQLEEALISRYVQGFGQASKQYNISPEKIIDSYGGAEKFSQAVREGANRDAKVIIGLRSLIKELGIESSDSEIIEYLEKAGYDVSSLEVGSLKAVMDEENYNKLSSQVNEKKAWLALANQVKVISEDGHELDAINLIEGEHLASHNEKTLIDSGVKNE